MSDVEKTFSFLRDNIPQWLEDIGRVQDKATIMQAEVTKIAVSESPFAKPKFNSIESIRPDKLDDIAEGAALSNGAHTDPLGNRKRKTLSVLSGRVSGPSRYRPRTMVVVSYDGDMQKSFELLVRAIGTGRNMLRKAKMEARMNELAALAGSSDDDDEVDDGEEETIESRISYRPRMSSMRARAAARRSGRLGVSSGSNTPVELFDTTDKMLEQAQELCEKAAHLALRDGDCRKELEDIRKNFEHVLETAKTEVGKCNARKSHEPPDLLSHDTSDTSVSSIETLYKGDLTHVSLPAPEPEPQPKAMLRDGPTVPAHTAPKIIDMEVDDEEDEDIDFVMPPIRLTSRLTART